MFRRTYIWMSMLGILLTACQAGTAPTAPPTFTPAPTFAALTEAATAKLPTLAAQPPTPTPIPTATRSAIPTQAAHADWVAYHDNLGGFTILYPPTWEHSDSGGYPAIFSVMVASGTTLVEKMMWINVLKGVTECSNPNAGGSVETAAPEKVTAAGGIAFLKESGGDAGAGQRYASTSYSTLKDATCVSVTFILHSSNPQMYASPPPDYDPVAESAIFEEILNTFRFDP